MCGFISNSLWTKLNAGVMTSKRTNKLRSTSQSIIDSAECITFLSIVTFNC